jgi:predicted glycoside hydrolase/deacetylase ChbG (UPF0249 family)
MHHSILPLIVCTLCTAAWTADVKPLVERLGFAPDTQVLIINADDFGMNNAATVATMSALKAGCVTSATIMVPCSWFPLAARQAKDQPKANIGVHLTLTSEWGGYKWGPVLGRTAVPSLVDAQGYFHPDVVPVYSKANLDDVRQEIRAQVQKALDAGIDVTHMDSHMGTLQYNPKYHEVYLEVAGEFDLPVRMAGTDLMTPALGGYLHKMADELGIVRPDRLYLAEPPTLEETETWWKAQMSGIPKGMVSEVYIHCGLETPEMEATTGSYRRRTADTEFFSRPETLQWVKDQGIELISYRELRHLQRHGEPMPRVEGYGWE